VFEDDDEDIDTSYDLSRSEHKDEIRHQIVDLMKSFFKTKTYWAGGQIPKNKLLKEEYVRAVAEMNVMDAYAIAYYCLSKNTPDGVDTSDKNWQMQLCYGIHQECGKKSVPKCHSGGIILVCLSLCYGIEFLPTLKKLHEIRAYVQQQEEKEAVLAEQGLSEEDVEDELICDDEEDEEDEEE
jgi:hypothetical protein